MANGIAFTLQFALSNFVRNGKFTVTHKHVQATQKNQSCLVCGAYTTVYSFETTEISIDDMP